MRMLSYSFLKFILWMLPIPFLFLVMLIDSGYVMGIVFEQNTLWSILLLPVVLFLTIASVPYIYTIVMSFKLLVLFEKKVYSVEGLKLLDKITKSSLYYAIFMSVTLPFVYIFVEYDDSPGLLLGFLILTFGGYIASAFSYVLKEVLNEN